jgi:hypothetical protein
MDLHRFAPNAAESAKNAVQLHDVDTASLSYDGQLMKEEE